jgi:hypothetical protein
MKNQEVSLPLLDHGVGLIFYGAEETEAVWGAARSGMSVFLFGTSCIETATARG